jgi:hypothetical protein
VEVWRRTVPRVSLRKVQRIVSRKVSPAEIATPARSPSARGDSRDARNRKKCADWSLNLHRELGNCLFQGRSGGGLLSGKVALHQREASP